VRPVRSAVHRIGGNPSLRCQFETGIRSGFDHGRPRHLFERGLVKGHPMRLAASHYIPAASKMVQCMFSCRIARFLDICWVRASDSLQSPGCTNGLGDEISLSRVASASWGSHTGLVPHVTETPTDRPRPALPLQFARKGSIHDRDVPL
jgi:hypothetical protein